jgi:DNA repair protein RadC
MDAAEDHELVMLLLGCGSKKQPVAALARQVLLTLTTNNPEDRITALLRLNGMGPGKTLVVAAAVELGRRLNAFTLAAVKKPKDVIPFVQHYAMQPKEHFVLVTLNGAHEILQIRLITVGTATQTLIHPREIFAEAIKDRASAIIVCHNHPSGSCTPSPEDIETTARIYKASRVIGINILDHIIISRKSYYSFRENGQAFDA